MTDTGADSPAHADREIPSALNTLYREVILDHYRKPRNKRALDDATHAITMSNPLCGDVIELLLRVESERIIEACFLGRGCSISQASVSMLTGRVLNKTPAEVLALSRKFTRLLHGDDSLISDSELGDLRALAGVSKFPVRIKCALLGWNCIEELAKGETLVTGSPSK